MSKLSEENKMLKKEVWAYKEYAKSCEKSSNYYFKKYCDLRKDYEKLEKFCNKRKKK